MENEVWKDIEEYEGLYQISDKGRVKSLKFGKERIMKPGNNGDGYLFVWLWKNGERKKYKIHRLVAQAFLHNPNNLPQVNHKDEDKTNNRVENLEFCDRKYNCNYGTRTKRQAEKTSKPVIQFTKSGEFIKKWKSLTDVHINLGYYQCNISSCCTGKRKSANGFIWKYKN